VKLGWAAAAAATSLLAAAAHADEPRQPLPEFMRDKSPMSAGDLADKKEGPYFTGLPLANSDPDTGIGFGARAYFYDNGPKNDELFDYTPYRQRAYAQAFFTTTGYQYHTIDYDAPYVGRAPIRLRGSLVYERNTASNYFGTGPQSLTHLGFPGSTDRFGSLSSYTDAIRALRPDGTAFTRFNQYILQRPEAIGTLERDFFGGIVRGVIGFTVSYVDLTQWTGRTIEADDANKKAVSALEAPTRLQADCNANRVRGCGGGFDNSLKLGIAFDTRDYEPDPNSGVFVDLTTEMSGRPIGSQYDWVRLTFSPRVYWSPFPKVTDLVIAGRVVESIQTADVPFFQMNQLSFTDLNKSGLGGLRTIRGFAQDRFVGRAVTLANLELRWTFVDFDVKKQHFALMLVPFIDAGRVFDTLDDFEFKAFQNGQGAGFRIAWNQATIIVVDYGVSREGSSLYVNFSHPF
jgi:hypothetical protein